MPWEIEKLLGPEITRSGLEQLQTFPALKNTLTPDLPVDIAIKVLEANWFMKNQLLRDSDLGWNGPWG
jgi:hypothetical protein